MPEIVISEIMNEDAIRGELAGFDVLYDPTLVDRPAELAGALANARALVVRNRTQVRGDLLSAAPRLEAVGRLGVGLDNIDLEACRARGIAVYPASGANDVSVAEYVICTAMLLLRGAYGSTSEVISGAWPRNRLGNGREIAGKALGLIGFGSIARETAARAAALGMRISAYDPHLPAEHQAWTPRWGRVERLGLDDLIARSDVVSMHVPLTPETRGLVGREAIARMKPDAVLINAARGGVVDEAAIFAALQVDRLGGAALDVFEDEPLNTGAASRFDGCPNLILTPHIAGVTAESNERVSQVTAEAIRKHLSRS